MKIIIHNSLDGISVPEALRIIRRAVPMQYNGVELAVNLRPNSAIIEPIDCPSINLFGSYGKDTDYTLLTEV